MSLFMQALLVAIFVTIAFIDAHTTQIHIFRPIVVGPVVGLIMGDVQTGFQVGVTVELMFLAVIFVGTAVPPNPTISTAIATGIAILAGGGTDIAVATALPVSFIGQVAETVQNSVINVFFMHRVEKATEKLDTRGIVLNNLVFPMAVNALLYGVPTFLAIYFGAAYVQGIIDAIPSQIITGLSVGRKYDRCSWICPSSWIYQSKTVLAVLYPWILHGILSGNQYGWNCITGSNLCGYVLLF